MPVRYKDFVAVATKHYGFTLVPGGKHNSKLIKPGFRSFPLPSHNNLRDEMSDFYLNRFCAQFEIDRAEFKKKL